MKMHLINVLIVILHVIVAMEQQIIIVYNAKEDIFSILYSMYLAQTIIGIMLSLLQFVRLALIHV